MASPHTPSAMASSTTESTSAFTFSSSAPADSWLVQKLRSEWSSYELGSLLTKEKISEAFPNFQSLETPIKVRFLLAFLCMKKDEFEQNKLAIVELIDAAEHDGEEWVRITSGLVKKFLFVVDEQTNTDTFLGLTLVKTAKTILEQVGELKEVNHADDHFFSHENAYLSASIRPRLVINPTLHFSVSDVKIKDEEPADDRKSNKKPVAHHRTPQLPRPNSVYSSSSSAASLNSSRLPTTSKPSAPKKNFTEVSTEIRKKADAGRFKRQRSRISMIDLDEIKQIESEKAQKAEERKRQKLAATRTSSNVGGSEENTAAASGSTVNVVEELANSETPRGGAAASYPGVPVPFPRGENDANTQGGGGYSKGMKSDAHPQTVPFPFGMNSFSSSTQFGDHNDPGFAPPITAGSSKTKKGVASTDQLSFSDSTHSGSFPDWR